jgi:hypothetical protein
MPDHKTLDELVALAHADGHTVTEVDATRNEKGLAPFIVIRHGELAFVMRVMPFDDHLCADVRSYIGGAPVTAGAFGMTDGRRVMFPETGDTSLGWNSANLISVLVGPQGTTPPAAPAAGLTYAQEQAAGAVADDLAETICGAIQAGLTAEQIRATFDATLSLHDSPTAAAAPEAAAEPPTVIIARPGGTDLTLVPGRDYIITYRIPGQRFDRQARMGFAATGRDAQLLFDAWDGTEGGTQGFDPRWVTAAEQVARNVSARFVGRRAPQPHGLEGLTDGG